MKFLCMGYQKSARFAALQLADFEEIGAICAPEQSRTLRIENGAVADDAGPFAVTPEPSDAFFMVEADDIDQAAGIARLRPGTHLGDRFGPGGIEVASDRLHRTPMKGEK